MNLSEIDLAFLERECRIKMPKIGDASLRKKIQGLDIEISDIYPVSGEAVKVWQTVDLNPDLLSLSGEYNEIQLKENIILPILSLAKHGIFSFLIAKCPEYPLLYEDEQIKLEGLADLVYGKAPVAMATYLEYPLICVHEYKRISNPVTVSRALAQLLGGMWIIARLNQAKGLVYPVYGLMVKGQNWHFAELHADENLQDIQHIDLFPSYDEGFRQIVNALKSPMMKRKAAALLIKESWEHLPESGLKAGYIIMLLGFYSLFVLASLFF